MIYYIGKFFSQLYLNSCEKRVLKKLKVSRKRKEVRIRAPFLISHPEKIEIGVGTEFQQNARINLYPELIKNKGNCISTLNIGKDCYFGNRITFLVGDSIIIGDRVLVADDVSFVSENHGINPEANLPYMNQELSVAPITVGDNCWIGEKTVVTAGVSIGKGCVIGAMSVVTKDIPDYCVAVGIPAKIIKKYDFDLHDWVRI